MASLSPGLINALLAYVSTLESPVQEVKAQIEIWAEKVLKGEINGVRSLTINGKTFEFFENSSSSAGDLLEAWTIILNKLQDNVDDPTSTGISFNVPH